MKKNVKSKWVVCQLLMLFVSMSAFAQDTHPSFKHYTVDEGLPSSEVYQVKQDSKGYIWFATGNGVSRFNGYEFENFSISNGLPDNTVFEIYEDAFERIWFVPLSCKLSYYYKGKIIPFQYNDQLQKLLVNAVKTSFCVDSNGTVFLGLLGHGIVEISKDGKITTRFSKAASSELNIIQPTPSTYIFSYYHGFGLRSINFQTKLQPSATLELLADSTFKMRSSGRIIHSANGKYLIGIGENLIIIDQKNIKKYTIEHFPSRIIWLYEDQEHDLWVGTLPGGMYYIKNSDFKNKQWYLPGISVNGIIQDKEGGFWYATEGNGVYYSASKKIRVYDKSIGFSDDRITCLATDSKNIFAGSQNGFVDQIRNEKEIKSYDLNFGPLHSNEISALFYDSIEKLLWVAGKFKSGAIKDGNFSSRYPFLFNAMLRDSSHTHWAVCPDKFCILDHDKRTDIVSAATSTVFRRVNAITQGPNNLLMVGAINGLWTCDVKSKLFSYIGYRHKLLTNRILDLDYLSDSLLIIATKGTGVVLYDNKNVIQIGKENGLCGNNVYAIYNDAPVIWAATDKGLNKIILTDRKNLRYKVINYTTINGLPSNEINDILKVENKIYLATNKGLSFFNPDSIDNPVVQLPVYLTRVAINDQDTTILADYSLMYNQNNIKINFTGLGYKNAGKLNYRYKMIGLDSSWIYTSTREVQFTTLPAKAYTLILNVQNTDGSYSTNQAVIHFNILLPFWKKWWFILIVILLVGYSMFYIIRYRLNKKQAHKEKVDKLNKTLMSLKLKALRAQMNPHFTFNVMNSIQHFIAFNKGEAANKYLSRFSGLIRLILNNSEKVSIPLADEIKALDLYLELEAMRFEQRFEYKITVDPSIDIMKVEIPSMLIQPYVENSVTHGILNLEKPGLIKIDIQKQDNLIKCTIEDNGIGRIRSVFMNKNNIQKTFGTVITQERLAAINELYKSELSEKVTDLEDENGNPVGTRVELYIPIIKE